LAERFPDRLNRAEFQHHGDPQIRGRAWTALAQFPTETHLDVLIAEAGDSATSSFTSQAIAETVRRVPSLLPRLMTAFESEILGQERSNIVRLDALAAVLSVRIDYFIYGGRKVDALIGYVIKRKKIAALAAFFKANRNTDVEDAVLDRIRALATEQDRPILSANLDKRTLDKLGIPPPEPIVRRSPLKIGAGAKAFLWAIGLLAIFSAPVAFLLFGTIPGEGLLDAARRYIIAYASYFAFYSIALNSVYLILLALSIVQLIRELRIWTQARTSFLTTERMMSPVSLIVPAFREEASIVENIRSCCPSTIPSSRSSSCATDPRTALWNGSSSPTTC
jgi:hypothetical protein